MLDDFHQRANRAIRVRTDRAHDQLANRAGHLDSLSPLHVLARGYSIAQKPDGSIVRSTGEVSINDQLRVRLPDGELSTVVTALTADTEKKRDQKHDQEPGPSSRTETP